MRPIPRYRGAVLVPILTSAPPSVIFVERAQHLRRHPGQIGFPGGIEEPMDGGDPVATALREFAEELGVAAERVSVIGQLAALEQLSSGLVITPIVGVLEATTSLKPDGVEIADAFAVPLASIVERGAIRNDVALTQARGRPMYALEYRDRRIWGFTARVLRSLVDAWSASHSPLRAAAEAALGRDGDL